MATPSRIAVAVVGDRGTGKTSLITTAAQDVFSDNPPPVVPVTRFPSDFHKNGVDLLVYDTSSKAEDQQQREESVKAADAIVLCFDAQRRATLERLRTHWMPELTRLRPGIPVVIACCKAETDEAVPVEQIREFLEALIGTFPAIEVSIRTSARHLKAVQDVFYHAIKTVLYPKAPLLDAATGRLTTPCVKALLRIFLMCDADQDGALSDAELNTFQFLCFGQPLTPDELGSVRQMVAERMADGLNDAGLLFPGFMYLHTLFLTRGRLESTWQVLDMFGYNHELRISDRVLEVLPVAAADTVLELSETAIGYLRQVFDVYESSRRGVLSLMDLEHMFNRAPQPIYQLDAWNSILVSGATNGGAAQPSGGLTREGFLTKWRAFAAAHPRAALEQMMYLGLAGRLGESAGELFEARPRRRRGGDKRGDVATRTTLHCAVFGAPGVGKSCLIKAMAGRRYDEPLPGPLCAAGQVVVERSEEHTLVLLEAPRSAGPDVPGVDLSRVDVAAVVFDSADPSSFEAAKELVVGVSTAAGDSLPVVLIASKDDLGISKVLCEEVRAACADLALPEPHPVSVLLGSLGPVGRPSVFWLLASAALWPEGHIPDTPQRKARRQMIRRAALLAGAGLTTAVSCYAAFRIWRGTTSGSGGGGSAAASGSAARSSSSMGSGRGTATSRR